MKYPVVLVMAAALSVAACSQESSIIAPETFNAQQGNSGLTRVTSSSDAGPGSLRAAIEEANADVNIRRIQVHPGVSVISLESPVVYTGSQRLEIKGHGLVLDGSELGADETNFLANGGGDLEFENITFRNAPGNGLTVQVPPDAMGTQRVWLRNVAALDNGGHGVEINDQEDPDDAGDPDASPQVRGNSNGSAASLEVTARDCRFDRNGFSALDRDGLRVNEGGDGNLLVVLDRCRASGNGADGVELDERGPGDVRFDVAHSQFARNGDFDQSAEPDKDDGFDVDEVDDGDLIARVVHSSANDNFEEGFDFNENDLGDMRVEMRHVEASRNAEEGVDLEEDDDFRAGGSMFADLRFVRANGNATSDGDGGIKIRERDVGDLNAIIEDAEASGNAAAGIHLREQEAGNLNSTLRRTTTVENEAEGIFHREDNDGDLNATVQEAAADDNGADGMDFDENDAGNLDVEVRDSSASGNTESGIRADEGGAGAGSLLLDSVVLVGNATPTTGNVPPSP